MPTARHWHGTRLLLAWLALLSSLAAFRWAMVAGTYSAAIEDQRVTRLAGHWTPAFATNMTLVAAGVVVLVLVWVTLTWVKGKHDREAMRVANRAAHRKLLL